MLDATQNFDLDALCFINQYLNTWCYNKLLLRCLMLHLTNIYKYEYKSIDA